MNPSNAIRFYHTALNAANFTFSNLTMSLRYQIFLLLTGLLVTALGYGTYATAKLLRSWRPDRNLLLTPAENALRLVLLPVCVGLGLLSNLPPSQLGWSLAWQGAQVARESLLGIAIGTALALLFFLSTRSLKTEISNRFYSTTLIEAILPQNDREFVLVCLAMVPVVLVEELLFRSLLIGGFAPLAPVPLLILATGCLFGIMHSPQGVWGMMGAGLAGILFGLLFVWFGTLFIPIVAHYVANIVQILIAMRIFKPQSG